MFLAPSREREQVTTTSSCAVGVHGGFRLFSDAVRREHAVNLAHDCQQQLVFNLARTTAPRSTVTSYFQKADIHAMCRKARVSHVSSNFVDPAPRPHPGAGAFGFPCSDCPFSNRSCSVAIGAVDTPPPPRNHGDGRYCFGHATTDRRLDPHIAHDGHGGNWRLPVQASAVRAIVR